MEELSRRLKKAITEHSNFEACGSRFPLEEILQLIAAAKDRPFEARPVRFRLYFIRAHGGQKRRIAPDGRLVSKQYFQLLRSGNPPPSHTLEIISHEPELTPACSPIP